MNNLLLYCRPNFEKECVADIQDRAAACESPGFTRAEPNSGYVLFTPYETGSAAILARQLDFRDLMFARQIIVVIDLMLNLPSHDRITPLLAALEGITEQISDVFVETADTNESKQLLTFCRKFAKPFTQALRKAGRLNERSPTLPRLHVFFLDSSTAYLGLSLPGNSSPWFMGIPRLKLPSSAPSRAALKLEEAFQVFLSASEREQRLRPGLSAVDLGAAPGGWTWQLTRRHISVTAVDNGPLDPTLLESGLVTHRREDGFRHQPHKPVDWLVCDMVERPILIAQLVARWLAKGWCRECIFNLKLPMKKRYREILRCRGIITETLLNSNTPYRLAFKQLYHDREEVTGHLRLTNYPKSSKSKISK